MRCGAGWAGLWPVGVWFRLAGEKRPKAKTAKKAKAFRSCFLTFGSNSNLRAFADHNGPKKTGVSVCHTLVGTWETRMVRHQGQGKRSWGNVELGMMR